MQNRPVSLSPTSTSAAPRPRGGPAREGPTHDVGDTVTLSDEALGFRTRVGPPGPRLGDRGERVQALQEDLLRWMPGWQDHLEADGVYGPKTQKALEFFKKVQGTGRDGRSVDPDTAEMLHDVRTGEFWAHDPDGRSHNPRVPEMEQRYQKALRTGYPLADRSQGLSPAEIRDLAASDPQRLVRYRGHEARAVTWKRYLELEKAVRREFPGHHLAVTCTTEGEHQSVAHPDGRGIDFVLERDRDGYRPDTGEFDSGRLADLARQKGFEVLDEYVNDSALRTGPHIHAEAW